MVSEGHVLTVTCPGVGEHGPGAAAASALAVGGRGGTARNATAAVISRVTLSTSADIKTSNYFILHTYKIVLTVLCEHDAHNVNTIILILN